MSRLSCAGTCFIVDQIAPLFFIFSRLVQLSFAMKTLILGSLLLVILSSCIHLGFAITALDDETYGILVQMIEGKFNIPVAERTAKQNAARVRFWRNKDKLSLEGGLLCFEGKAMVKKSAMKEVVKKSFKKSKGSGSRKIYHRLKDFYSGTSELSKSTLHQKLNARFENRARLRPIRARDVQIRHQVDLVDMKKLRTKYKGKVKYVLSVMDVFSRYHWLVPIERKLSSHVARELIRIYREHGAPRVIQHDQGTEFDGAVSRLCKALEIKVIKGCPYHPHSQGKVERAHRTFKKKLRFDFLAMRTAGVNWVKGLPTYAQALNQDPKEELSWKSPFEVYFGRKPNLVAQTGNSHTEEWDVPLDKYEDKVIPRPRDYRCHFKNIKAKRTRALSATEKCANRMVEREAKKHPPSVYNVGETVLIRYPGTGSKLVKKRYVLEAQILKRNIEKDLYKVAFSSPI